MFQRGAAVSCAVWWLAVAGPALAQTTTDPQAATTNEDPPAPETAQATTAPVAPTGNANSGNRLARYYQALADKKLAPPAASSVEEIRERVLQAERLLNEQRTADAVQLLFEVVHSPRFADFSDFEPFQTARYTLAGALFHLGAFKSAQDTLDPILTAGPEGAYFAPAYRKWVTIALAHGELDRALGHLALQVPSPVPAMVADEWRYLQGRAAFDRGVRARALEHLGKIGRTSRFYANAQYLLGALAARDKNYPEAERRFCKVAQTGLENRYSFFVDERFFEVRDLSRLALGRVAHESGRADDAFYYYFQVPNDSRRVAEALFESAYATYEGGDHDTALDSLDQLQARFKATPVSAEASVLRGYIHLARCEFSEAERHLTTFKRRFTPVLQQIDAALRSSAHQRRVYADLVAREQSLRALRESGAEGEPTPDSLLLSLLSADPEFFRLHQQIQLLDEAAARATPLPAAVQSLQKRLRKDAPAPTADATAQAVELEQLRQALKDARRGVAQMEQQLAQLRARGAAKQQLRAQREAVAQLDGRIRTLADQLRQRLAQTSATKAAGGSNELSAMLTQDLIHVSELPLRAAALRTQLERAASLAGRRALQALRNTLATQLRRARIGRIDAVMGAKRRMELQIESLAAGRFPPELMDPLRMQGLLRDDEEYWPFEGEDWQDEFLENYSEDSP